MGMERRSFGSNVCVSVLGIGCGRVGSINNPVPMREIEATLEASIEAGINLFDTADIYGQGDSERTLGRLLRHHHDRMFVVTKVGGRHGRYAGLVRLAKPLLRPLVRSRPDLRGAVINARTASVSHRFVAAELRAAVDASRRHLAMDVLDGLLLHNPSPETLRDPEIQDFLNDVLHRRHARAVGASVDSVSAVEAAVAVPSISLLQTPLSIAKELTGTNALRHIRERKIALFVREVLSGADGSVGEKLSLRQRISAAIEPNFVTAAIIGVSTRHHLNELLAAVA
jgi:aryl-alcohol dehydrogenase-like predicted oxidoreductase